MGPALRGPLNPTPFGDITGPDMGADWRNALSNWVHRHAYYPDQAIQNDESGDSTVDLWIDPDGHVTSVELEAKSGSPWLDMALTALFRNAHLPALPTSVTEPIELHFTMHWILRH